MKSTTFGLTLMIATVMILGRPSVDAQEKKQGAIQEPSQLAVVITQVKDLDDIDGHVTSKKKRDVRIVLANLLPYAKWPTKLSKEEEDIKKRGLKLLKDILVEQKMVFWGIDKGDVLYGDLRNFYVQQVSKEPFLWDPNKPSGKSGGGWLSVHVNALVLEEGHTVYVSAPAESLNFSPSSRIFLHRTKFFTTAENYAIEKKNGVWKDGKNSPFGVKLREIAAVKKASE